MVYVDCVAHNTNLEIFASVKQVIEMQQFFEKVLQIYNSHQKLRDIIKLNVQ